MVRSYGLVMSSFVALSLVLVSGCGGGGGKSSKTPRLDSVTPEMGSSNTIWTLVGDAMDEDHTVTFDGYEATVVSATDTAMRVTLGFAPVGETQVKNVIVSNGKKSSKPIAVFAMPDGSFLEFEETRTWRITDEVERLDGKLYVLDKELGLYELDEASGEILRIGPVGTLLRKPTAMTVVGGVLHVIDDNAAGGDSRVFRLVGGELVPFAGVAVGDAKAAAALGSGLVVLGEFQMSAIDAAGDELWLSNVSSDFADVAVLGGEIYVTDPTANGVYVVDTAGTATLFSTVAIADARGITATSTDLYVTGTAGITSVNGTTGVPTLYGIPQLPANVFSYIQTEITRDDLGNFLVYSPLSTFVGRVLSPTAVELLAIGMFQPLGRATIGDRQYISQLTVGCHSATPAASLPRGVIYELRPGGARILDAENCALIGMTATPDGDLLFTSTNLATLTEVVRLDPVTGERTVLADQTDGIDAGFMAVQGSGADILVMYLDVDETKVARIDGAGTVTPDFITGGLFASYGAAVSGDYIYAGDVVEFTGVYRADIRTGGTWEPFLDGPWVPFVDSIVPDGNGGIFFPEILSHSIAHATAEGVVTTVAPSTDVLLPVALDRDPIAGGFHGAGAELDDTDELVGEFRPIYILP